MGVRIVCGPPGAGKSTFVDKHKEPGQPVLDWDTIYAELSGRPVHDRGDGQYQAATEAEFRRRMKAMTDGWVIRCAPGRKYRAHPRARNPRRARDRDGDAAG